MTSLLLERLAIGTRELIAIVGAGGKTTAATTIGRALADEGSKVVITTTTKMARDQVGPDALCSTDPDVVAEALDTTSPLFVACHLSSAKVTGPTVDEANALFAHVGIDHIVIEADGARRMSIKAPADHEPQIPPASTLVIVVASALAIGRSIDEVAHRPEVLARLAGTTPNDILTVEHVAKVLSSPLGGLKGIPASARRMALLTNASTTHGAMAEEVYATGAFDGVVLAAMETDGSLCAVDFVT